MLASDPGAAPVTRGSTRLGSGAFVATPDPERPVLEAAYGAPSQAGHGSTVFYEPMKSGDDLDQAARWRSIDTLPANCVIVGAAKPR